MTYVKDLPVRPTKDNMTEPTAGLFRIGLKCDDEEAEDEEANDDLCDDDLCDEETAITEITFLPDGRLCLFGASREILEIIGSLQLGDPSLDSRRAALRTTQPVSP